MHSSVKYSASALLALTFLAGQTSSAQAYGAEGLFGGRPEPDSSIVVTNPVDLKNDRPERAESVLEHPRPDYDPVPIEFGSFELFPLLELGENYESNIFATQNEARGDAHGIVRPVVNLFSNWGRHAVSVTAFGDFAYYSQHPNENYQSLVMDVSGRYDVLNQVWFAARAGHQYLAESRTSPDDVNGQEPVTFNLTRGGATFYHGVGLLKLTLDYDFKKFAYEDTPATGGVIYQGGRSRNEHIFSATVNYNMEGNLSPYVRGAYNMRDYVNNSIHDAEGFDAVVGATMDFGGITSLDLFAGWMVQNYDYFGFEQQYSAPKLGGRVDWNVTRMTSVVFEVNRTIEETNLTNFHSYYATGGSVTLSHELLRNVLLEGDVSFTRLDFNGIADRQDDMISAGGGGRYMINRNLYTDLMYNWERRYSTAIQSDYVRNLVMFRLGVRL